MLRGSISDWTRQPYTMWTEVDYNYGSSLGSWKAQPVVLQEPRCGLRLIGIPRCAVFIVVPFLFGPNHHRRVSNVGAPKRTFLSVVRAPTNGKLFVFPMFLKWIHNIQWDFLFHGCLTLMKKCLNNASRGKHCLRRCCHLASSGFLCKRSCRTTLDLGIGRSAWLL